MRIVVTVAAVLAVTPAWAAHHKVRHAAPHARQVVQPVQPAPTKPAADPLYESCDYPWRHPELSCPGVGGEGG
jgi:hypothetical protein